MLAPTPSVHDSPGLLGDLRFALSLRPELAEHLKAGEQSVRECLEAIRDERGEVLV